MKEGSYITAQMRKDREELNEVAHTYITTLEKAARDNRAILEKEHKLRQEAEGELTILKGIETNRVKEAQEALANALAVNESHQKLNGKLQEQITELEQENLELHADNKKLSKQIEDKVDSLRKAGM